MNLSANKYIAYGTSVLFGVGFGLSVMYITQPIQQPTAPIPVINFANAQLHNDVGIIGSSPFSSTFELKGKKAPGLPQVPDMPSIPSVPGMPGTQAVLTVIGVLPPDVVILQKGPDTVTAKVGSSTKFGVVNSVSMDGAVIDGSFVELKR